MTDREKVIERLGRVSYYFKSLLAVGHQDDADIYREHMESVNMARALLKEQEAVEPINSYGTFRCGNCENIVGYNDGHGRGYQNNFCSKCGKAVKWDDLGIL